ncbi:MAG: bifunctional diaminohydroxyphosphoribosylaminopyrimidine deaminase/5-amino-6-(5-phosphoribosylamino)uracil reductase RibD [Verrucomicrobiales bacterium]|nr:bifunctional diaminohydroxyphosphoribosylaminopyrimidine deaminase/5-amino-6-(5-phosphoribosylamino)uracil reductase RibD [Verrucomicrobiota bacterium JB025]
MPQPDDTHWMRLALDQARNGVGRTAPNPPVGCVIVKNDTLLGSGWHRAAGQPHAEREALADVRANHGPDATRGATAYVTLEPCSTHGRTPPCTDGLISAGIARVVYACTDENPDHAGRADEILRAAGIQITSGTCRADARKLLRPFFKVRRTGLPWVIWKTAMSLDGRLTRPPGESQWLTGETARADVQKLRATCDAILTTGETVRRDKPALTIRVPALLDGRPQPWRVIFTDHPDTLPADAPLFTDSAKHRTLIRPRAAITESLRTLAADHDVLTCMTEAGGVFSAALFDAGLVDEAVIYYAPRICGGPVPALAGTSLPESLRFAETSYEKLGDDIRFSGIVTGRP